MRKPQSVRVVTCPLISSIVVIADDGVKYTLSYPTQKEFENATRELPDLLDRLKIEVRSLI